MTTVGRHVDSDTRFYIIKCRTLLSISQCNDITSVTAPTTAEAQSITTKTAGGSGICGLHEAFVAVTKTEWRKAPSLDGILDFSSKS
ncbi:MAG: hypothetical protein JSV53_03285 [candidate division WOR-3 bacterium]|nr:MAG: hypothetical protein JSV53_03285 [candidate division WOR-3 bacterium]